MITSEVEKSWYSAAPMPTMPQLKSPDATSSSNVSTWFPSFSPDWTFVGKNSLFSSRRDWLDELPGLICKCCWPGSHIRNTETKNSIFRKSNSTSRDMGTLRKWSECSALALVVKIITLMTSKNNNPNIRSDPSKTVTGDSNSNFCHILYGGSIWNIGRINPLNPDKTGQSQNLLWELCSLLYKWYLRRNSAPC